MTDPGGNDLIDSLLRQALNIAWVKLGADESVTLEMATKYVICRLIDIGPWPESPEPERFPFLQRGGDQVGE